MKMKLSEFIDKLECLFLITACKYSSKKAINWLAFFLICYLAIFTTKPYYDILLFVSAVMGIRAWENNKNDTPTPQA